MQENDADLGSFKVRWTVLAIIGLLTSSFSFYMATGAYFFLPARWLIALFGFLAIILDLGTGWAVHKRTGRRFGLALLISSIAILAGATLISMAILRGGWPGVAREILRSISTMR